jgi:hypothetical protein
MAVINNPYNRAIFSNDEYQDLGTPRGPNPETPEFSNDKIFIEANRIEYYQYPLLNQEKHLMWIMFEEVELSVEETEELVVTDLQKKQGFDIGQIIALKTTAPFTDPSLKKNEEAAKAAQSRLDKAFSRAGRSTGRELRKNLGTTGCALYLPGSVGVQDGAEYTPANLGFFGEALMQSLSRSGADAANTISVQQLGDAAGAFMDAISEPVVSVAEGLSSGQVSTDAIVKLIQSVRIGNLGDPVINGISAGLKRTSNPHTHALFQNVGIRKFTFAWEFVPSSKEEADQMRKIIQFFRKNLYPDVDDSGQASGGDVNTTLNAAAYFTYKFPTMLRIKIGFIDPRTGEFRTELDDGSPFAFKVKDCYITGVNTTFDDQSSMTIHQDGHFVSARMELSLTEESTLTRSDIRNGY